MSGAIPSLPNIPLWSGAQLKHRDNFTLLRPDRLLGPFTQPPVQWVPGALSLGLKRPGLEDDHLPPSSAEVKIARSYTSTPSVRLHGVVLS
jgi:hypothetical protein